MAVMATPLTLSQEKFQRLASNYSDKANFIPIPCPGLADLIEKYGSGGQNIRKYLADLFGARDVENIDSVVLGCTHYALIEDDIRDALPPSVKIFDGSFGVAKETRRRLSVADLLSGDDKVGSVKVINTALSQSPVFEISTDDENLVRSIISNYNKL